MERSLKILYHFVSFSFYRSGQSGIEDSILPHFRQKFQVFIGIHYEKEACILRLGNISPGQMKPVIKTTALDKGPHYLFLQDSPG